MASSILRSSFVKALFPAKDRVSKDFAAANLCLHRIALVGGVMDFDTKSNLIGTDERKLREVSGLLRSVGLPIRETPRVQVLNCDSDSTPWPVNWRQYNKGADVAVFCWVNNYYSYCSAAEEKMYQRRNNMAFLQSAIKNEVKVIFVFSDFETCINTNAFRGEDYVCLAATEEYADPQGSLRWNYNSEFKCGILIQSDYLREVYPHIDQTSRLGRRMAIAMKGEDPTAPSPRAGA